MENEKESISKPICLPKEFRIRITHCKTNTSSDTGCGMVSLRTYVMSSVPLRTCITGVYSVDTVLIRYYVFVFVSDHLELAPNLLVQARLGTKSYKFLRPKEMIHTLMWTDSSPRCLVWIQFPNDRLIHWIIDPIIHCFGFR